MKTVINNIPKATPRIVLTSKTCKPLAEKIKRISAQIMKQNHQLYKDLENK